jgi:hypothetical protein
MLAIVAVAAAMTSSFRLVTGGGRDLALKGKGCHATSGRHRLNVRDLHSKCVEVACLPRGAWPESLAHLEAVVRYIRCHPVYPV